MAGQHGQGNTPQAARPTKTNEASRQMKQAILMAFVALVAACGTIDGVGQDISSASRTVESWF